jgi:hypothetical protein
MKRLIIYKRNVRGLIMELVIPVLIILVGLGMANLEFFFDSPPRQFTLDGNFPSSQNIMVNKEILGNQALSTHSPEQLMTYFTEKEYFETSYLERITYDDGTI